MGAAPGGGVGTEGVVGMQEWSRGTGEKAGGD